MESATVHPVALDIAFGHQAQHLMRLAEALTTALDDQQVAECVCSFLVDAFDGRAVVALGDHDALVIAALGGFTDAEVDRWIGTRVGATDGGPIAEAARRNTSVVLHDLGEFERRYPALGALSSSVVRHSSCLSVPLRADPTGFAIGALYVGWPEPRPITEVEATVAGTVSSLVTLALARIAATRAIQKLEFRRALDAMLDDVAIGRAVRSDDGAIVDFVIDFVNSHGARDAAIRGGDLAGRLVGEVYPEWLTSGMFVRLCDVVETGVPYRAERLRWTSLTSDRDAPVVGYRRMQIAKFADGYIAASRDVTELVEAEDDARQRALKEAVESTAISLLQAAALPTTLPELPGVHIAAVYEPADPRQPVGGDWYDVFALDDERIAIVIADVAGHGHQAAVFMIQVRNVFRAIALEHTEPGDVLRRANDVTARLNEVGGPFVTCCYAILDIAARTLRWAQAGHFSPLIIAADGTARYLDERPGPPLALFEGKLYESSSIELQAGDRVVMFTDGLVERRREHLDIGLARLGELATSCSGLAPLEFVEALAASVTGRFDDLAVVCIDFEAE